MKTTDLWIKVPYPYDKRGEGVWINCRTPYEKRLWEKHNKGKGWSLPTLKQAQEPNS